MAASVAAYFALQNPKTSSPPQSYSVGDLAGQDVVAPRKLSLADPLETELRRERELSKGPVLFRFDKTISTQVVARFNKEVASMRADFLDSVEKVFNTRTLDTNQVARPIFRQLVIDFRHKHTNFPITVIKAARWVQGDAEEKLQKQLSDKLRVASKKLVHPDGWPDAAQGDHLRVIASDELPGTNANLFQRSQLVIRTNIVAITKVREILQSQLPREQYATARFLAGFIEVNCIFDADLTRQLTSKERNPSMR